MERLSRNMFSHSLSHAHSSPYYSHVPKQHLEDNHMDLYTHIFWPATRQRLLVPFIRRIASECDLNATTLWGADGFIGENSNSSPGTNIYDAIADMALSRLVSGDLQRPQGRNN